MSTLRYPSDIFAYKYLAGPVNTAEDIECGVSEGNCRFALQLYFYRVRNIFLKSDEIYLPGGYKTLGTFIYEEEPVDFSRLAAGDIVFAENLRNKEGELVDRSLTRYSDKDKWLYHLHSAIFVGNGADGAESNCIWHSTRIAGGPILWNLDTFLHYYKPISAKRI